MLAIQLKRHVRTIATERIVAKMNLSFAGCGFLGIYHVGVAVCFKKYAPHLLLDKISGASAGCLAATCLLCDMPLGELYVKTLDLKTQLQIVEQIDYNNLLTLQRILSRKK